VLSVPRCLEGQKIRVEAKGGVAGGVMSASSGSGEESSTSVLCSYGLEVVRWRKRHAELKLSVTYRPKQEGEQKFNEIVSVPFRGGREYSYQNGVKIKVSVK
jgi:hypothetical protein